MIFDERTLWQNIKSGDLMPVYLITGDEPYLKLRYTSLIADAALSGAMRDFNEVILQGDETNIDDITDSCLQMPAGDGKRCVRVTDMKLDSLSDGDTDKLMQYLADPAPDTVLIFLQNAAGFSKKTKKAKDLYTAFSKSGGCAQLDKRTENDLVRFIVSSAKEKGFTIDPQDALYMLSRCGDDMSLLEQETEKLGALGCGTISRSVIDDAGTVTPEATSFQMTDAIFGRNARAAFEYLDILFEQKTEPMLISGALISLYTDIYRVKAAKLSKADPSVLSRIFPAAYKSSFKLKKAVSRASSLTMPQIKSSLDILADTDRKLKSTSDDKKTVFQQTIVRLMRV